MIERTEPIVFEVDLPRRPIQRCFRRTIFETSFRKLYCPAVQTRAGGANWDEARRRALLEKGVHSLE